MTIRGHYIAARSGILRSLGEELADLEAEIVELERRYVVAPASGLLVQIREKITEYNVDALRECRFGESIMQCGHTRRADCLVGHWRRNSDPPEP